MRGDFCGDFFYENDSFHNAMASMLATQNGQRLCSIFDDESSRCIA